VKFADCCCVAGFTGVFSRTAVFAPDINMKPPPFATDDQQVLFHADVREEEVERVLPSEGPGSRCDNSRLTFREPSTVSRAWFEKNVDYLLLVTMSILP